METDFHYMQFSTQAPGNFQLDRVQQKEKKLFFNDFFPGEKVSLINKMKKKETFLIKLKEMSQM